MGFFLSIPALRPISVCLLTFASLSPDMSQKRTIFIIVGTRPNFIKVTQFRKVAESYPDFRIRIIHTGQHFDEKMADVFFRQFNLIPDIFLNITPAAAHVQMAEIIIKLGEEIEKDRPDLMMVVGDVNSTFAAALVANKLNIPIAHLESGLRSFDRTMPEEHNRVLTDAITDFFFVTEQSGLDHLRKEGHSESSIHFVGNTMIDTMVAFSKEIENSDILSQMKLHPKEFVLMTMHRPATVDSEEGLKKLHQLILEVTRKYTLVFPIHPRTVKMLKSFGLYDAFAGNEKLLLTEPLDYFAFQKLIKESRFILTDSGGIQEESTFLGVPCLTLRPNTERPVTVTVGSNELLPFDLDIIQNRIAAIENGSFKKGQVPPLWDGRATERVMKVLSERL
jgi:UDP-N-acetylglucosamine 2-epimerase (non-hydrolysing)